jgi:hypothetical protein
VQTVPEIGQLAIVRKRPFVITEIIPSAPGLSGQATKATHLIKLSSVEDDGLGEELQVIWELEPGTSVHEKSTLPNPDSFDHPMRLQAFLDAVRWGAVSQADDKALQSPFRSGIEVDEYQLDPVVRALSMPRVNLLIADDVGLGKTIEAGLVVQEMILRHRVRTVLIVCPSSLQVQWQEEMRDKFGLEFRIIDSEAISILRRKRGIHVNPWSHFPRLITSIDFIKRERPLRTFRETLPSGNQPTYPRSYDLIIVDEAHNVAPSGRGKYATDSMRTLAIRSIAPHFEHKLFLSATPHNGYRESFAALLELLDNQRFARIILTPDRAQLDAVMVRRMKSELKLRWDGSQRFAERIVKHLEVPYTNEEQNAHRALQSYSTLRLKQHVENVVRVGLELAEQPALIPIEVEGIWPDPTGVRKSCPVFRLPALSNSWAQCAEGLAHPHTRTIRPIVFDAALANGRDDVVLAHLNHRLVQMCLRLLRAEIWSVGAQTKRLSRVSACVVDDSALTHPVIVAHGRIVVLGGDNHRLHEEIITAGGALIEGRFSRLNVGETKAALQSATNTPAPAPIEGRFQAMWGKQRDSLLAALESRRVERTKNLEKNLDELAEKEVHKLRTVMTELQRAIEAELERKDGPQLMLDLGGDEPGKQQRERDLAALRDRLKEIPGEIDRESSYIRSRFANPSARLFPVAVTWLIPRKAVLAVRGSTR